MRRLLLLALTLLATAGLVAGCGSSSSSSSGVGDPAKAVPASSLFFASVQVRPQGDARSGAQDAGRKILDGKELGPELQKLVDQGLRGQKLSYDRDISPWLGRRLAVAVTGVGASSPEVVVLANVSDEGSANDFLVKATKGDQKRSYRDVDYYADSGSSVGVSDGYMLVGTTPAAFRAAVDTLKGGASLASSSSYKTATAKVTTEGLGLFYADTKRLVDVIGRANPQGAQALAQLQTLPQFSDLKPTAAAMTADGDAIRFEAPAAPDADAAAGDAVAKLPADSWLAFAAPKAGRSLRTQLNTLAGQQRQQFEQVKRLLREQTGLDLDRDVLGWIQGFSVYASGTTIPELNAGMVIDSSDPAASRRALDKIATLIARQGRARVRRTADGFTVRSPQLPHPFTFAVRGDRVVVAYGANPQAALSGSHTLAGSHGYAEAEKALGGGKPSFLLSVPTIVQFARNLGAAGSPDYARAAPYLKAFGAIAAGIVDTGGRKLSRIGVGLR